MKDYHSHFSIVGYLLLDILLSLLILLVSITIFVVVNNESFFYWVDETIGPVVIVGFVSLASMLTASIWLYTYLLGRFLSRVFRNIVNNLLAKAAFQIGGRNWMFDCHKYVILACLDCWLSLQRSRRWAFTQ